MQATDPAWFRTFLAIELGADVRAALARMQSRLQRVGAHVGWIPPPNFHLSLAFLGDIAPDIVNPLCGALGTHTTRCHAFQTVISGLGWFGGRVPRVIWAGAAAVPELMQLQQSVTEALRAVGLDVDRRPYRPHITLGRVRSGRGRDALLAALQDQAEAPFGEVWATRIRVFQSVLGPEGAQYLPLGDVNLTEAG